MIKNVFTENNIRQHDEEVDATIKELEALGFDAFSVSDTKMEFAGGDHGGIFAFLTTIKYRQSKLSRLTERGK